MSDAVGGHSHMVRTAMREPFLARDEEHDLARRWAEARDTEALHKLIRSHMRLVLALAQRFRSYGLPMADLAQEGHVGLMEAATRFDPGRDVRFSTYATWWIRAAMQDYVLRNWSIVRGGTSSGQKALFFNLRRIRAQLERDHSESNAAGAAPTGTQMRQSIATAIGVRVEDVARMEMRLAGPDFSLNAPLGSDEPGGAERQDQLVDEGPLPDEQVSSDIDGERRSKWLQSALRALNEREMRVIRARRLAEEGTTLEALGARLGVSKERVRQIENRAIEKLRRALTEGSDIPRGAFV
ncbi:MAG TPA: RNA polymerase factor sigma-32 [Xanthobacteraceae bacterium]|nr:RNA polymerase factor sigma-32 [Xanthobacteraceae bacterium]